ncbi:MAG: proton-conducting transporter membrane subunit [Haloferacaceae archaeon]
MIEYGPAATEVASLRPLAAVAVPGVATLLIVVSARFPRTREVLSLAAALGMFGLVAGMVPDVLAGRVHVTVLGTLAPGVEFGLRADPLGALFGTVASGLYVVTVVYSVGYLEGVDAAHRTRFFAGLAGSLSATLGVAFATNLLVLLLFYELLTVATYPLVVHEETPEARAAGYKYVAYAFSAGVVILAGTALLFWVAGTVAFVPGGTPSLAAAAAADPSLLRTIFGVLVAGFAVKAAVMPLHGWLPSAMVAPTPVSGLLHAVAVVKAGVFGIARVVLEVFGPDTVAALGVGTPLAVVAGATILLASLLALRQDNLKRRLAYSTIAQLSYIVLGLGLLAPAALLGALIHLPAHAFAKLTLFLCAGALHVELGVDDVSDVAGVGRRMPLTMAAFGVASLSMAGIPLLAGFVSKWFLVLGGVAAGRPIVALLLVLSGALNVAYFWPVVFAAFFERPGRSDPKPVLLGELGGSGGSGSSPRPTRTDGAGSRETENAGVADSADDSDGRPFDRGSRRRLGRETTPLLWVPILATVTLAVVLGVIPDDFFFLDAARTVVENATGVRPP